jgi:NAD(P)-dependent dehydrogenase (short-subunit alcohol dehydrogenase family)
MSKAIIITGGSRGIGAATARLAGKRGWSVAFSYRDNAVAAEETRRAIEAAGGKAIAVRGDVASEADVVALFDAAAKAFGTIDGVVNNAGTIIGPPMPVADMSVERFQKIMAINVVGAYLVAREGIRRMGKTRGGRGGVIVNLSSAAAKLGGPGEYVDYAGSKGAIDSMTIGLGREVAGKEGIRVVAVRPGMIETEFHATGGIPDRAERVGGTVPIGRAGTADEVAELIVWLLSDAASYVTATTVEVTGGR